MSGTPVFIEHLRQIVGFLRSGGQLTQELVDYLEGTQDALAALYEKHEQTPFDGAEVTSELFKEAVKLIHDGIEEILIVHDEGEDDDALASALSNIEEGSDVLATVRYTIENDTSWATGVSLG